MWKCFAISFLVAAPVWAEGWKNRAGDVSFVAEVLQKRLSGQMLVFFDEGRSVFHQDGRYTYTYSGGGTWEGRWQTGPDSTVCVTFVTNVRRCDRIVENEGKLVVLTKAGDRFPVKP